MRVDNLIHNTAFQDPKRLPPVVASKEEEEEKEASLADYFLRAFPVQSRTEVACKNEDAEEIVNDGVAYQ